MLFFFFLLLVNTDLGNYTVTKHDVNCTDP